MKKSGEDEEERNILMKSGALRFLDFIRVILSSSSLVLVEVKRWPLWLFSDISSDVLSDISFAVFSDISSDILSDISAGSLCGISSAVLFDILSDICLSFLLALLLTFFLTSFLAYLVTYLLTFFDNFWHSFWRIVWPFFLAFCASGASSSSRPTGSASGPAVHHYADQLAYMGLNRTGEHVNRRLIQVAFRVRSLTEHPDTGGSDDRMKKLNDAKGKLESAFLKWWVSMACEMKKLLLRSCQRMSINGLAHVICGVVSDDWFKMTSNSSTIHFSDRWICTVHGMFMIDWDINIIYNKQIVLRAMADASSANAKDANEDENEKKMLKKRRRRKMEMKERSLMMEVMMVRELINLHFQRHLCHGRPGSCTSERWFQLLNSWVSRCMI